MVMGWGMGAEGTVWGTGTLTDMLSKFCSLVGRGLGCPGIVSLHFYWGQGEGVLGCFFRVSIINNLNKI